jgi:hypothetical protein
MLSRLVYSRGTPTILGPITNYEYSTVVDLVSLVFSRYGLAITKTIKVTNPVVERGESTYELYETSVSASHRSFVPA